MTTIKGVARQSQTAHQRKEAAGAKPANLSKMPISGGYESDYHDWLSRQAQALRSQQPDLLDWQNLAEEIEAMAAREKRELASHLKSLLLHLLKWKLQPGRRSASWRNCIENARDQVSDLIEASPSLKTKIDEAMLKAYKRGRREAANEMEYDRQQSKTVLPQDCPWSFDQVIDECFWPEPDRESPKR